MFLISEIWMNSLLQNPPTLFKYDAFLAAKNAELRENRKYAENFEEQNWIYANYFEVGEKSTGY